MAPLAYERATTESRSYVVYALNGNREFA